MCKGSLPNAQFKLVEQIRHEHRVKIESMRRQFLRKCILSNAKKKIRQWSNGSECYSLSLASIPWSRANPWLIGSSHWSLSHKSIFSPIPLYRAGAHCRLVLVFLVVFDRSLFPSLRFDGLEQDNEGTGNYQGTWCKWVIPWKENTSKWLGCVI